MSIISFPHKMAHIRADAARLERWAAEYERRPIVDEDDLFSRMQDLLAFVRCQVVNSMTQGREIPPHLRVAQGVTLDALDYLPDRLSRAMALEELHPETAARIPEFPGWENL